MRVSLQSIKTPTCVNPSGQCLDFIYRCKYFTMPSPCMKYCRWLILFACFLHRTCKEPTATNWRYTTLLRPGNQRRPHHRLARPQSHSPGLHTQNSRPMANCLHSTLFFYTNCWNGSLIAQQTVNNTTSAKTAPTPETSPPPRAHASPPPRHTALAPGTPYPDSKSAPRQNPP